MTALADTSRVKKSRECGAASIRNGNSRYSRKGASSDRSNRRSAEMQAILSSVALTRPGDAALSSDAALVQRCVDGDTEAFRPLVQKYQRLLFSVAFRMLGSRAEAQDAAQQAFTDAFAHLDRFRSDGREAAFSTWVTAIVVNRCKDNLKSKRRTEESLDADRSHELLSEVALFSHQPERADDRAQQNQDRRLLEVALLNVPEKYRAVLLLKDVEELPYEEIQAIMKLPLTTLKIRVVRARALMRVEIERLRGKVVREP